MDINQIINTQNEYSHDYKRNFQKSILNIDYDPHDICVDCVWKHVKEEEKEFKVHCTPLRKESNSFFDIKDQQDLYVNKLLNDTYFFQKNELGVELRKFQFEIVQCTSDRKVLRITRRAGKTVALIVDILQQLLKRKNAKILVLAPGEIQVKEIFERLEEYMSKSVILKQLVVKPKGSDQLYKKSPNFEFNFVTGAYIRGVTTGNQGGKSARGQDATDIYLDETQYIGQEAINAVLPILATSKNVRLVQASTPADKVGYYYELTQRQEAKHIHYRYQDLEIYDKRIDDEFRSTLTAEQYLREIDAEFTSTDTTVFPVRFINKCLEEYKYDDTNMPQEKTVYTLGVDWNESNAGVHIVVLKNELNTDKIKVQNIIIIPPSEFTQLQAVNAIIDLNNYYLPMKTVVDMGYGNTQIQLLKQSGTLNQQNKHILSSLMPIDFNQRIQMTIPNGGNVMYPIKPIMVSVVSNYLEQGRLILPKQEDKPRKLIDQMKSYKQIGISDGKIPQYSKGNVHTLEALFLQLFGMWNLSPDMKQFGMSLPGQQLTNTHTGFFVDIIKRDKPKTQNTFVNFKRRQSEVFKRRCF